MSSGELIRIQAPASQFTQSQKDAESLRIRAREIVQREICFIPNAEFRRADEGGNKLNELVESTLQAGESMDSKEVNLPPHLRRMCESKLLTHDQERALFREMNYLKFRANILRPRLDPQQPDQETVTAIEFMLAKAQTIRDHLIQSNMRLVMSIVKKFVSPQQSFDDMLSDGIFTLMRAVEKFDYDRGFRFSTYAYRSIARHAYQSGVIARKAEARITRDAEEWAFEDASDRSTSLVSDQIWSNLRELTDTLLGQLERRERFIIRSRYALGAHRKVRTFQYLADKLGVSKERVRQLEQRAVAKLQTIASEYDTDELFGAAMA